MRASAPDSKSWNAALRVALQYFWTSLIFLSKSPFFVRCWIFRALHSNSAKPKKGQFMNFSQGHSGTKVQSESRLFSQGKNTRIHKKRAKFTNFSFWPFLWLGLLGRLPMSFSRFQSSSLRSLLARLEVGFWPSRQRAPSKSKDIACKASPGSRS